MTASAEQHTPRLVVDSERQGVGAILRGARLARGEDLREVASALRIRLPYLEAIENGELRDLPGMTYGIGFVRAYSEHVGLDPEDTIARFKVEARGIDRRTELQFPEPLPSNRVPSGALLLIVLVLAGAVYGAWLYSSSQDMTLVEAIQQAPARLLGATSDEPTAEAEPQTAPTMTDDVAATADETAEQVTNASAPPLTETTEDASPSAPVPQGEPPLPQPAPVGAVASEDAPPPAVPVEGGATIGEDAENQDAATTVDATTVDAAAVPETALDETASASLETEPGTMPEATGEPESDPTGNNIVIEALAPPPAAEPGVPAEQGSPDSAGIVQEELASPILADSEDTAVSRPSTAQTAAAPIVEEALPAPDLMASTPATATDSDSVSDGTEGATATTSASLASATEADPGEAALVSGQTTGNAAPIPADPTPAATTVSRSRIIIQATSESWIRVTDPAGGVLVEKLLLMGEIYKVPNRDDLVLDTGNAGGLKILVDGHPVSALGAEGDIRRSIPLTKDGLAN